MAATHSYLVLAILASACVTMTTSQKDKPPKWKDGADALDNKYMKKKTEGEELKLACPVKGQPRPVVEWWKDNDKFFPRHDRIRMKGNNIKFTSVEPEDRGNYTCRARNSLGELEFTFVLDVIEKIWPLEANVSSNQSVLEGDDATFYCIVTNDPSARIQWMRIENNAEDIGARPSHTELDTADQSPEILILHDVRKSDEGQYTCLLGNEHGSKYHHMYLIVQEKTTTTTTTTTTTPTTTTTTSTTTTTPTTTTITTTTTTPPPPLQTQPPTTEKPKKKKKKDRKKNKKDRKKDKKKNKKKNKDRNREPKPDYYENEVNTKVQPNYYDTKDVYDDYNSEDLYGYGQDFNPNVYNKYNNGFPDDTGGYNSNTDFYEPTRSYEPHDNDDEMIAPADHDGSMSNNEGSQGSQNGTATGSSTSNTISVWTVYIIVGSVAGGILLAGLVAIAIALCCQKEEDAQYKSTSV